MNSIKELATALRELKSLLDDDILDEQEYSQNKYILIHSFFSSEANFVKNVDRRNDDNDFLQDHFMHTIRY